jgi:asparagine synthase (glutamine-hydrolysing)
LKLKRYWYPDFDKELNFKTDEEYIECYRELFLDSVRRLSRSHLTVAYEVSGGLDSSSVFCSAELMRRQLTLPAPAIKGYTLAFPNDISANELEYVRAVADYLGVKVYEIEPTITPLSWYREWACFYREFPGYPNGAMSLELRQTACNQGGKVMLSGSGGDEWFGTYQRFYYAEELASRRWRNLWHCFLADYHDTNLRVSTWWLLRFGFLPFLSDNLLNLLRNIKRKMKGGTDISFEEALWITGQLRGEIYKNRNINADTVSFERKKMGQSRQHQILSDAYSPFAFELEERMASRTGIELRHPMRTFGLVEFAIATPERLRMRGNTNKFMHVSAMHDILPLKVLERKSKADFSILFRNHLESMKKELTIEIPERRKSWVDKDRIVDIFECYRDRLATGESSSGGITQWILWNLLICDLIIDQFS